VLSIAFCNLALAQPFVFFLWLMRRACYIRSEPWKAAVAGSLYLCLLIAGLMLLGHWGRLSVSTSLLTIAASSFVVGLWLAFQLGVHLRTGPGLVSFGDVCVSHWGYGRWSTAAAIVGFIPGNLYYLLVPAFGGLSAAGALRALMVLIQPIQQTCSAMRLLLMPVLVRCRNTPAFEAKIRRFGLYFTVAPLVFWLMLGIAHTSLVKLAYGGRFLDHAALLWGIGLLPVTTAISGILGSALGAVERPDLKFYSGLASSIAAMTVGIGLMAAFGLPGVVAALLVSGLVDVIVVLWLCHRYIRSSVCQLPQRPW
jgi:O-antigen/teichoic acid export membrane protein